MATMNKIGLLPIRKWLATLVVVGMIWATIFFVTKSVEVATILTIIIVVMGAIGVMYT